MEKRGRIQSSRQGDIERMCYNYVYLRNRGDMILKRKQDNQPEGNFPAGLSNPARRALANAGIIRLEQLSKISETEIKKWHSIGPKGIELLRQTLAQEGLSFADESTARPSKK